MTASRAAFAEATSATFADLVLGAERLVVVDFYTLDCAPCRRLEPMLGALVRATGGQVGVVRVNAAEAVDIAERFEVRGVPTLLLVRGGEVLERRTGFQTASQLKEWVGPYLA